MRIKTTWMNRERMSQKTQVNIFLGQYWMKFEIKGTIFCRKLKTLEFKIKLK
jgi:hypothetical protein